MNNFYQGPIPKNKRTVEKWVERIVIAVGIMVFIPFAVLFMIGFLSEVEEFDPVVIRTHAELKEFAYPSIHAGRSIRLYTPLEPVGYVATAFGGLVTHHFYIGELEDTLIIIMVALPGQFAAYVERTATLAEVEGRISRPQSILNFRMMRDRLTTVWDMTLEEFDEMFTPYFVGAQWRDVNIIEWE